ncbi:hypothetical protein Tco_0351114 [Tanacetum coccineum]
MELLKKHGLDECVSMSTHMATERLDADLQGTPTDQTTYRRMIGKLMYLTTSRPDIAFATFVCVRYRARPTVKYLKEVKRIFRYLRQSYNMGLWYLKDSGFELIAYSDADHAGCKDDCKSTSGVLQFLGEKLMSWTSKKQDCTAMSTVEAEYVSLSACCEQVIWMCTQLLDYGYKYNQIPMYCDSKSAIAISCNPVQHSKTKHIDIQYHFIKEHVERGTVEIYFVGTEYQLADLFTKALPKERFEYLVHRIEKAKKRVRLMMEKLVIRENRQRVLVSKIIKRVGENKNRKKAVWNKNRQSDLVSKRIERIYEAIYKELDNSLVRASTTASSLEAEQDSGNINKTRSKATPNESSFLGTTSGGGSRGNTLRSGEDSLKLKELIELCTNLQTRVLDLEKTKTTQAEEIVSLKRRVKKLEQKKRSRTHGLKRLYKVSLTARVESSRDEESLGDEVLAEQEVANKDVNLGVDEVTLAKALAALKSVKPKVNPNVVEEPSVRVSAASTKVSADMTTTIATIPTPRKGIVVTELGTSTTITTISSQPLQEKIQYKGKGIMFDEEERLAREKDEANVALAKEWDDIQAKVDVDYQLAQRLQAEEQEQFTIKQKVTLFKELLEQRRKHFAAKRAKEKRNKPLNQSQQRKIMCTYLKNMVGKKPKDLKNKSFDYIQKMFDRDFKRVNTFVKFRTDLVEGSLKRAGDELKQEVTKKQKGRIVGIKSFLTLFGVTVDHIDVNVAQSKLVLLVNFNENYSKCLRLLEEVTTASGINVAKGVNAANEEVGTVELVMAISVISISSDSSEDSVGTPIGRVILFGTIPTTIPDTTPVITLPTTQTYTPVIPTETPIIAPTILWFPYFEWIFAAYKG